jgi:hypothetical protein
MATWNDGFEPAVITDGMEKDKSVGPDGKISFKSFAHTQYVAILCSMVKLSWEIPDIEKRRLILRSGFVTGGSGVITPARLLREICEQERKYLSDPKRRFRLLTSLSAQLTGSPLTYRMRDSVVCFAWRSTRATTKSRAALIDDANYSIKVEVPSWYSPTSVLVSARNHHEAAAKALDRLDLIRAIWNYWNNRSRHLRISSGRQNPVNAFILGPIHTLHMPDGSPATDAWWYEPSYRAPVDVWRDTHHLPKMLAFAGKTRTQLRRLPYRDTIISALLRYSRALDSNDWNTAFLQLWSILELLTGTTANESHKTTVKRTAFAFKDFDFAYQSLLHLRSYRNAAIHSAEEGANIEPMMYQAKNAVEGLLNFHLRHAGNFASLGAAIEFLDSPADKSIVEKNIRNLIKVRRYLGQ